MRYYSLLTHPDRNKHRRNLNNMDSAGLGTMPISIMKLIYFQ